MTAQRNPKALPNPAHATAFMGKMAATLHRLSKDDDTSVRALSRDAIQSFDVINEIPATESLARMRAASAEFYGMATATGCHAFIEFAGLMNEMIKVCEHAQRDGLDWRNANTHSGIFLPFQEHQIAYLNEKLTCIFQGLSFASQPATEAEPAPIREPSQQPDEAFV